MPNMSVKGYLMSGHIQTDTCTHTHQANRSTWTTETSRQQRNLTLLDTATWADCC